MVTIHIPVEVNEPAEFDTFDDIEGVDPLFTGLGITLYQDPQNFKHDENVRATMIAEVVDSTANRILFGDIVLRCPEDLGKKIVENDQKFQREAKTAKAFHAWMLEYAEKNNVSLGHVALTVGRYIHGVLDEADQAEEQREVQRLAELLGVDASQIGVIRL